MKMPRKKKYYVTFTQYWEYWVEADDETDAEKKAYEEFQAEMRSPIAVTSYDDVEVKYFEPEED